MYIRPSVVRRGGKTYRYFRLVRSVRHNGKVVQEAVAQLGELDARGRREARALAERICGVRVERRCRRQPLRYRRLRSARCVAERRGRFISRGRVFDGTGAVGSRGDSYALDRRCGSARHT